MRYVTTPSHAKSKIPHRNIGRFNRRREGLGYQIRGHAYPLSIIWSMPARCPLAYEACLLLPGSLQLSSPPNSPPLLPSPPQLLTLRLNLTYIDFSSSCNATQELRSQPCSSSTACIQKAKVSDSVTMTQNRWVWYYLWAYKTWGLHYKQQQAGCNTQWTQQKAGPVALLKPPSVNIHLSSMATHTGHSTRSFEVCRTPHPHEKTLGSNIFCLHLCEI